VKDLDETNPGHHGQVGLERGCNAFGTGIQHNNTLVAYRLYGEAIPVCPKARGGDHSATGCSPFGGFATFGLKTDIDVTPGGGCFGKVHHTRRLIYSANFLFI